MPRFVAQVNVGESDIKTFKSNLGTLTDADVNKPVKLSAADTVTLCSATEEIYGFINSVETNLADGKSVVGVQVAGRKMVTLTGAVAVGQIVEAATNTAAGVALGVNWGLVQIRTPNITSVTTLRDTTPKKLWMVISGAGTTGTDALLELQ